MTDYFVIILEAIVALVVIGWVAYAAYILGFFKKD